MKYLHKFRAMPLFRKSKRRCRLDHYLIAAPSNPVYRIVFLTKFRSSLVSRSNKQTRSEEHTSELQSLMRISYAVFCLKKKKKHIKPTDMLDTLVKNKRRHEHNNEKRTATRQH